MFVYEQVPSLRVHVHSACVVFFSSSVPIMSAMLGLFQVASQRAEREYVSFRIGAASLPPSAWSLFNIFVFCVHSCVIVSQSPLRGGRLHHAAPLPQRCCRAESREHDRRGMVCEGCAIRTPT